MTLAIRPATADGVPFLWSMLYEAAYPLPDLLAPPPFADFVADGYHDPYIREWGRPGDLGFVAEFDEVPAGAAWVRLFPEDERAWGFLGTDIPELSIAVVATHRGMGIGTALLSVLRKEAETRGFRAISLSVAGPNRAKRLYERAGFKEVAYEAGSRTMRLDL